MRWAAWMSGASTAGGEGLVGIHVLEEEHLRAALRYHHLDELVASAERSAKDSLRELGVSERFAEVHVLQGESAEQALPVAAAYHACEGIILGRQASREGMALSRLGRVARRVLRRLPRPVIIVPPDVVPPADPGAPIVAACSLDDDCAAAVEFAIEMAERLARPLVLVHVVPHPDDYGARVLPAESLARLAREHQEEGEQRLAEWSSRRGIAASLVVVQGETVRQLIEVARQRGAAMIVAGSRRLNTFERVFLTSSASQTAAAAPCAVAVVPPAATDK